MNSSFKTKWFQDIVKNQCEVCEVCEESPKVNTGADYKETTNLTNVKNRNVRFVRKTAKDQNLTDLTNAKKQNCEDLLEEKHNKIIVLSHTSHTSQTSQAKNINVCKLSEKDRLKEFLGEDWGDYKDNPEALEHWSNLLAENHLIDQGEVPSSFTATTHCIACGDVFIPPSLVNGGKVLGCPWCWNRTKGLPVPKPN